MLDPEELSACAQSALDALRGSDLERVRLAEQVLARVVDGGISDPIDDVNLSLIRARLKARAGDSLGAAGLAERAVSAARFLPEDETGRRLLVQALADLADFRRVAGMPDVQDLLLEALRLGQNGLGENDPDTASVWNSLGMCYRFQGRFDEAEAAYRAALSAHHAAEDDSEMAAVLHNLASLRQLQGDLASAEELIRQALVLRADDELGRAADLGVLAAVLCDAGQIADAKRLYARIRVLLQRQYGPGSPELAYLEANVAVLVHSTGDLDAADRQYRVAAEATQSSLGQTNPQVGVVLANWAQLAVDRGHPAVSRKLARRAVMILTPVSDDRLPALALARKLSSGPG